MKIGDLRKTNGPITVIGVINNVRGWLDVDPFELPIGSILKVASEAEERLRGGVRVTIDILKFGGPVSLPHGRDDLENWFVSVSADELSAWSEPV